jgi:hypothetical protein
MPSSFVRYFVRTKSGSWTKLDKTPSKGGLSGISSVVDQLLHLEFRPVLSGISSAVKKEKHSWQSSARPMDAGPWKLVKGLGISL